jgi:uncharacterized membrane protein YgcG
MSKILYMFKKLLISCAIVVCFTFANSAYAQTDELSQEQINKMDVTAVINSDGSVDITERIDYSTGPLEKHGIFRELPLVYDGSFGKFKLKARNISVTDDAGVPVEYSVKKGGTLRFKIGDADKTFTGEKIYVLKYSISRPIKTFDEYDEFYWNVTGNNWNYPILQTSIRIESSVPSFRFLNTKCFVGNFGSTQNLCENSFSEENSVYDSKSLVEIRPKSGYTVAVSFPKNLIRHATKNEILLDWVLTNLPPLFAILFSVLIVIWAWIKFGRDSGYNGIVIPEYEAPNVSVFEAGTVFYEKTYKDVIVASVLEMATLGFLKIKKSEEKEDEFLLELGNSVTPEQNEFYKHFLEEYFNSYAVNGILTLPFKKHYPGVDKKLYSVKEKLENEITHSDYFNKVGNNWSKGFAVLGILLLVLCFVLFKLHGDLWGFSALACAITFFVGAYIVVSKSEKGTALRQKLEGLKMYMKFAEEDRLKFFNAPQKNFSTFEKLLPWAVLLGVVDEWSEQFKDFTGKLQYYEGGNLDGLSAAAFAHSFSTGLQSSVVSSAELGQSAASGGSGTSGGFSGGGFGGGGGGSW